MKDLQLQDGYKISSKAIRHNGQLLSDILDDKLAETIFYQFVYTNEIYNTFDGKKFSDYKFLEINLYAGTGTYSNIISTSTFSDGTIQQISKYESSETAWATPLFIYFQYLSDTSIKCVKCGYISNGNYNDNPYTLIIKGIK